MSSLCIPLNSLQLPGNSQWKRKLHRCVQFCDPMDCSLPGSSVHGILQARVLEWAAISFPRGSSQPRDWTWVSRIAGRCFNLWATRETTVIYQIMQNYFSKCLRQFLIRLTRLYEMSSSWPALGIVKILATLTGLKRYFLVLICISLITDQLEHLFVFMLIHFFEFTLLASPIIQLLFDFSSWFLEILHIVWLLNHC